MAIPNQNASVADTFTLYISYHAIRAIVSGLAAHLLVEFDFVNVVISVREILCSSLTRVGPSNVPLFGSIEDKTDPLTPPPPPLQPYLYLRGYSKSTLSPTMEEPPPAKRPKREEQYVSIG